MNKNISEEVIEIGGKEYTLFLNRAGVVAWERAVKLAENKEKYEKYRLAENDETVELKDDSNPFETFGVENIDNDIDEMNDLYAKFYWIVLYTHHEFSISQAREVFDKAIEEYGIEQLAQLTQQMLEAVNTDNITNKKLKNLKALKPTN